MGNVLNLINIKNFNTGDYIWEKYEDNVFVGYVVDKNETKYPDDGELDGAYYHKFSPIDLADLSCSGYETGEFILSSSSYQPSVSHSLGKRIRFAFVYTEEDFTSSNFKKGILMGKPEYDGTAIYNYEYKSGSPAYSTIHTSVNTETSFTFRVHGSYPFKANTLYKYVLIA